MSATGAAPAMKAWRSILEYFEPAYQLGMTATPLREDNRDTYLYFGNPLYQYSLRQGIEDGFLAPYRVHRVITEWDAAGWRPSQDELDRYGRAIPDDEYETKDFERVVALRARTRGHRPPPDGVPEEDRPLRQDHRLLRRSRARQRNARRLVNLEQRSRRPIPDYVCRVTADEGDIGRGHLSRFQDVDTKVPTILTTSQLLTTGVDAPTCKNIVLARVVGSMTEFKQIIGRGTRVRDDYGKLWFNIIDYTGSATRLFADPDFDGDPARITEEELTENGETKIITETGTEEAPEGEPAPEIIEPPTEERRKFYFDGGQVEIAAHLVYELDPNGKQLRVIRYTDYAAETVRTLCPTTPNYAAQWADPVQRSEIIQRLAERGIGFDELAEAAKQPEADPFDLLCHLAFNAPLRTRRERAQHLRESRSRLLRPLRPRSRQILEDLLEKYAEHGDAQFILPDVLHVPPISDPRQQWPKSSRSSGRGSAPRRRNRTAEASLCRLEQKTTERHCAADHRPIARQPPQVRPRHHAQGQGAERRPRPPAAAHLDHVPEIPR